MLSGTRVGAYEIVAPIGSGGMGEVYRARDPRLNRDVAIKLLPAIFASDPERLRRFEQEALATSALNHPNILTIYDIGTEGGAPYMVAELLDGSELRGHMDGPMPARIAIDYARQIAQGLAAAHAKGIVHRDLKPENIFVTVDGRVKILDFGLAKLTVDERGPSDATRLRDTQPGAVMGTVGYMAPEQVRGLPADSRTDIFAFGAILYEMFQGRRAFAGDTPAETMTAILKSDPAEVERPDVHISPALDRIVRRCLEKAPERRFQSAHDLAFALDTLTATSAPRMDTASAAVTATARPRDAARLRLASIALSAVIAGAIGGYMLRAKLATAPQLPRLHLAVPLPEDMSITSSAPAPIALSPDGRNLAFVAEKGDSPMVWVRAIGEDHPIALSGTERADPSPPIWAPDGRSLAFLAEGKLKRVNLDGGQLQVLCDASTMRGGAWSREDVIVLGSASGPLVRLPATGGTPTAVVQGASTGAQRWPQFLPDGRVLFWERRPTANETGVYIGTLASGEATQIMASTIAALYSDGQLLFMRDGALVAQAFDLRTAKLGGEFRVVAPSIAHGTGLARGAFTVSENGVLAYSKGGSAATELRWFDRSGKPGSVVPAGPPSTIMSVDLSANDRQPAVSRMDPVNGEFDIWQLDVDRESPMRLTLTTGHEWTPIWSPDGKTLAYARPGSGIFLKDLTASAAEDRQLVKFSRLALPEDWLPDGTRIVYSMQSSAGTSDLMMIDVSGKDGPTPFLATEFTETHAQFSPDGKWIAYVSDESRRPEIYVRRFPDGSGKRRVSSAGGDMPRWRGDGRELFFVDGAQSIVAVAITTETELVVGPPRQLFATKMFSALRMGFNFDVSADGQRFLVNSTLEQQVREPISILFNWAR